MESWHIVLSVAFGLLAAMIVIGVIWIRRSRMNASEATARLRELGIDLVRLPGTLRRLAADPRTPRRARWILIALAIYVVSPIDVIPDFIPVIGHLDEIVIVPFVLFRVRRMVPDALWTEYFPTKRAPTPSEI